MTYRWSQEIVEKIGQHKASLMYQGSRPGLPVYSDMSGCLVLTADGIVLYEDSESGIVKEVHEAKWLKLALVSAVAKFPDLREILPKRPAQAQTCPDCSGAGKHFGGKVFCGRCSGLGWIEEEQ